MIEEKRSYSPSLPKEISDRFFCNEEMPTSRCHGVKGNSYALVMFDKLKETNSGVAFYTSIQNCPFLLQTGMHLGFNLILVVKIILLLSNGSIFISLE